MGGDSVQMLPPEILELKPLQRKDLRQAGARPKVVSCLVATTYGKCHVQMVCQTLYKRIIFIWHRKLFREISFFPIAKT